MANNFNNFTLKIAKGVLESFESSRTISKNVNTQMLTGKFNPDSGDQTDFKRPTDYVSVRTANGDVSAETKSDIITGRASGYVQDYFTAFVDYDEADEAIKMGNLQELLDPMGTRIATDMEVDFASFAMKNTALLYGTPGTPAATWDDIAGSGAMMDATGVPTGDWKYFVNPFTQRKLASSQRSLGAGGSAGGMISEAHRNAIITDNFAGMKVMTANTLASYTNSAVADRAGTLSGTPDATYLTARNTMTQTLAVTAMGANAVVKAGETVQVTGRNRLNLSTRKVVLDETGAQILWTGTVTADVTLDGSGAGNLVVTGPALFEAAGQYNTSDSALTSGDVITRLGAASAIIQPNLFFQRNAFSIGSVPMKRLHATDTFAKTEDGLQLRVTRFSDGLANENKVRVDLRCAYAVLNPFFAGQGFGV